MFACCYKILKFICTNKLWSNLLFIFSFSLSACCFTHCVLHWLLQNLQEVSFNSTNRMAHFLFTYIFANITKWSRLQHLSLLENCSGGGTKELKESLIFVSWNNKVSFSIFAIYFWERIIIHIHQQRLFKGRLPMFEHLHGTFKHQPYIVTFKYRHYSYGNSYGTNVWSAIQT